MSVVRAVDGQETGLSVQPAEKKNRLQTGQEFYLQSALVQASLPLKQQPTGQHKERDRLPASQPYTVASTGYSVPATQPCTLASTTGYRVYRLVLATQPCTLASATGYRVYRLVLATQPCTLASFYGITSLLTGCWLHSPYCTVLQPNWFIKKKKKLAKYRPVAVKIHW